MVLIGERVFINYVDTGLGAEGKTSLIIKPLKAFPSHYVSPSAGRNTRHVKPFKLRKWFFFIYLI